jgi:group II intron reverse transcriptase/maturase
MYKDIKNILSQILLNNNILQTSLNRKYVTTIEKENLKKPTEWQERWFLSSNAKDIGTCAAWAFISAQLVIWYTNPGISGILSLKDGIYLLFDTDASLAKNLLVVIAGVKCGIGSSLPYPNGFIKRNWYGYVKKLDTYRSPWVGPYVLSRILRRKISRLNATKRCSDPSSCLKAEDHSNEESNKVTCVQGPKSIKTISIKDKNSIIKELSDLSASTSKRRRNSHSSPEPKIPNSRKTKGSSEKSPIRKQGSRSMVSNQNLRMFVMSRLEQYKDENNKYNGIIRILADPGFLQFCYMLIKGKPGNMSAGITRETLDGISYEWFCKVSEELKTGKFKFTPARRVIIPKPGKKEGRPLGVGSPKEKIVQKGLQVILEAIYESKFLDCSHGFRPNRSTHSALRPLYLKAHQFTWVIQGDISKCFDRIPHEVIMNLIKREIICDRTLGLIMKALTVGFVDQKSKQITRSKVGTPQGSVLSPLLANIVLNELDTYLVNSIIPENQRGKRRKTNPIYDALSNIRYIKKSATPEEKELALKKMLMIPRMDNKDPGYRRSMYIRYADDFVFLFEGPISECKVIKEKIKSFLITQLGLELNDEKTVITHINEGFNFLGAIVKNLRHVDFRMKTRTVKGTPITMRANVRARINMPTKIMIEKLIKSKFARINHEGLILAKPQTGLINLDHATIVQFYNSKVHGILNYYSFAANRIEIHNLIWILRLSLAKTLARKYKLRSARQTFKKFGPLLKDPITDLNLFVPKSLPTIHKYNNMENFTPATKILELSWFGRLTQTNLFKKCVICNTSSNVQMHHLRIVKDVRVGMANSRAKFKQWIGATQRKQIPLCQYHHSLYHNGKLLNYEINLIAKYNNNMTVGFSNDMNSQKEP